MQETSDSYTGLLDRPETRSASGSPNAALLKNQTKNVPIYTENGNLPPVPKTLSETGLSESFVRDLLVKHLYRYGTLAGREIAEKVSLPFPLIDAIVCEIISNAYAEKRGGRGLGNSEDRFTLTDLGREYARDLLSLDTYTGPAPIPTDQYSEYVRRENIRQITVNKDLLTSAWRDLILEDRLIELIGPAVRSGKSCFLYGPPGTGKTTIAKAIARFLDRHGGQIAVPHALLVGGSVIRIYDPVCHEKVHAEEPPKNSNGWLHEPLYDRRWVLCHRPAVVVGGEL
ncbi:MAG: AAA family ATPase, partial [bacterium]